MKPYVKTSAFDTIKLTGNQIVSVKLEADEVYFQVIYVDAQGGSGEVKLISARDAQMSAHLSATIPATDNIPSGGYPFGVERVHCFEVIGHGWGRTSFAAISDRMAYKIGSQYNYYNSGSGSENPDGLAHCGIKETIQLQRLSGTGYIYVIIERVTYQDANSVGI